MGMAAGHAGKRNMAQSRLFPALLLLLYAAQCLWFTGTQSLTWDEPIHIKAGLEAWRGHRFEYSVDHPPLARLLATLPIVGDAQVEQPTGSPIFDTILPGPSSIAWRTRTVIALLGVALGSLLWHAARSLFSAAAAHFALVLFAFTPALIAHFSMVTTDGIVALMIFAAAIQLARWNRIPTRRQAILLGVVLGLLLLAKMSTPPFFCLALGLVLIRKQDRWRLDPRRWNWRPALAAGAIACAILWGGYFFHVSHVTIKDGWLTATSPNRGAFTRAVNLKGNFHFLLPAGEYFEALYETFKHNKRGHPSYLMGRISQRAEPWYYLCVIVLKWPTVILVLSLAGLAALVRRGMPAGFAEFLWFPALVLLLALSSRIGIGERHILALYPFALLYCAALWFWWAEARAVPSSPRLVRKPTIVLVACLLLHIVDVLRCAPGYLSYINAAIRPGEAYKLLTDSNLDWGQGLLSLRRYQAEHPDRIIHLAYFGNLDPAFYGIRSIPLPPDTPQTGTVAVSASNLSGQYLEGNPNGYKWLLQYPLETVLDGCIYVFSVPEHRGRANAN
jgi:4-amino-4-deoxy-L-arabinose transferase-like glycosyltransferase